MAETIKSALLVDYDSLHRSLKSGMEASPDRLASRSSAWVAAIESGRLVSPKADEGVRRRVLIRRCYADPHLLGEGRSAFVAAGFEVIDCPAQQGSERNAAAVHMVLDTVDALEHPTGYDEFILLSAGADLSPVLLRLRAHNRTTLIYAGEGTAAAYRAIADGMVEEEALVALLSADEARLARETSPAAHAEAEPAPTASERGEVETLARRIHTATNVPLIPPRTFADLFRFLSEEIADEGYHFQKTAENVARKLAAAGRNVNRRQVFFVVKGLALKGHVFSTTDTPERLAEVFREQVLYLAGNAGLVLDERERALLPAWISGRAAASPNGRSGPSAPALPARVPPRRPAGTAGDPSPVLGARQAGGADPHAEPHRPATREADTAPASVLVPPVAGGAAGAASAGPAGQAVARPGEAGDAIAQPAEAGRAGPGDGLETSILAAIAEAVDVLVEDSAEPAGETLEAVAIDVEADEGGGIEDQEGDLDWADGVVDEEARREDGDADSRDADDIGSEIQRIIASYSRGRSRGQP